MNNVEWVAIVTPMAGLLAVVFAKWLENKAKATSDKLTTSEARLTALYDRCDKLEKLRALAVEAKAQLLWKQSRFMADLSHLQSMVTPMLDVLREHCELTSETEQELNKRLDAVFDEFDKLARLIRPEIEAEDKTVIG